MKCVSPKLIWPHRSVEWCDRNEEYPVSVACGKCLACLVNSRSEWSFRLEQEHKFARGSLFVTLTYDEKHLRCDRSLCKRDVQLFLKRLRKADGTNRIRYFAVGEYGSRTGRPHYHLLLFNLTKPELIAPAWCDSKGNPIGMVHIGKVTAASIRYCTKYIVQPELAEGDREKPFRLMSRRFGIGGRYLSDEVVEWHRSNLANYVVVAGEKMRLARFYKEKIWYGDEKERVSKVFHDRAVQVEAENEAELRRRYGESWQKMAVEIRNATLRGIKSKVAFSQKF